MNISTQSLRKFKELAAHIRRQKGLEIDSYIRFGGGMIVKNAFESCIQFDCPDSNENILVNENDLYPIIAATSSEFINICNDKKGGIVLSDGKVKLNSPTSPFKDFLSMPEIPAPADTLDADFFHALKKAYPICAPDEEKAGKPWYCYVHVGNQTICTGDGSVGFCQPINPEIKIVIKREVAAIVSQYKFTSFSESDKYQFFHSEGLTMGFAKAAHVVYTDIRFAFNCNTPRSFSYSSTDLWSFNSLFIKVSKSPMCSFLNGRIEAWDMYISDKTQTCEAEQIVVDEEFPFSPEKLNRALEALDVEELDFHKGTSMYFIKSTETKATAIIAKMYK